MIVSVCMGARVRALHKNLHRQCVFRPSLCERTNRSSELSMPICSGPSLSRHVQGGRRGGRARPREAFLKFHSVSSKCAIRDLGSRGRSSGTHGRHFGGKSPCPRYNLQSLRPHFFIGPDTHLFMFCISFLLSGRFVSQSVASVVPAPKHRPTRPPARQGDATK